MKPILNCIAALFVLASFSTLQAQNTAEEQQKAYVNYMTPGPVHQWMAKGVGEWKVEVKLWMDGNIKDPMQSTGSCTNSMVLGGRYLQSKHNGEFMGMAFEGVGTTAYDNAKKVFVTTWIDNMGTGISHMEGTMDEKNKTISFKGTAVDPLTGKDQNVREVQKYLDDNTMVSEYYLTKDGKEYKSMELKLTRK